MFYQRLRELWRESFSKELKEIWNQRLIEWRRDGAVIRIVRPTRLDRARALGYRAKQGILLARVRVLRGGRKRRGSLKKGRRSKNARAKKIVDINYQTVAEQRANKKFKNCEVLNSYYVGKDGKYMFYEVILIDRDHPQILNDKQLSGVAGRKGRVFRGLTASGKRSRGILTHKGKGAEKLRPSRAAHIRRRYARPRK